MASPSFLLLALATSLAAGAAIGACGGDVVVDGADAASSTSSAGGASSTSSTGDTGGTGGGLAAGQCRSVSDCPQFMECVPPGGSPGCGVAQPLPPCNTDADCAAEGPTIICAAVPCSGAPLVCTPGCTSDAECSEGETCGPTHHCAPTACASESDCPTDFDCDGSACQRRVCAGDGVCSGYCVNGACYDAPGTCSDEPV